MNPTKHCWSLLTVSEWEKRTGRKMSSKEYNYATFHAPKHAWPELVTDKSLPPAPWVPAHEVRVKELDGDTWYSPDSTWNIHVVFRSTMGHGMIYDYLLAGVTYDKDTAYSLGKVYPGNCWNDVGTYSMIIESFRRAKFLYKIKGMDKSILTLDTLDAQGNRLVRIPEVGRLFTGRVDELKFYTRVNDFMRETWGEIQYVITADKDYPIPVKICNIAEKEANKKALKDRVARVKQEKLNKRKEKLEQFRLRFTRE